MPDRAIHADLSHDKIQADNVKLLIALRRALGTRAKTTVGANSFATGPASRHL